ncbi:SIMPL domain-containing protein [Patescibacteria group bacterium]|nr:SIMPL domain-containing protein [Patescibacteria group bacterium]
MKNFETKKKYLTIILLVIVSVFLIFSIALIFVNINNKIQTGKYIGQEIEFKNTIYIAGEGIVYAIPDTGLISISVITEKLTVELAMSENTAKMNKIISGIKKQRVKEKDIKTTKLNIYPKYNWEEKQRKLIGYEVRQTIKIKIRDLDKAGDIIQQATSNGANSISDLQFIIDNEDELKKQARTLAIKQAKAKAKEIGKELGVEIIRIVDFNESSTQPIMPMYRTKGLSYAMEDSTSVPQIETGENEIKVNVNITFEII